MPVIGLPLNNAVANHRVRTHSIYLHYGVLRESRRVLKSLSVARCIYTHLTISVFRDKKKKKRAPRKNVGVDERRNANTIDARKRDVPALRSITASLPLSVHDDIVLTVTYSSLLIIIF